MTQRIVGRARELRVVLAAVAAGKPILLFGLPGVSKTTIVREVAVRLGLAGGSRLFTATGDEQLTAFSLVGTFDPALVLHDGYKRDYFVPGPLVQAMTAGGILYVEELNRAPSGVLNVLLTCLSEGYLDVPRYGRVMAEPGFVVVGACNPLDDVGTGRLARGLADRFVVLELDYQPRHEELLIVRQRAAPRVHGLIPFAVDIGRATRNHPDLRYGASVRGAMDFVQLIAELGREDVDEDTFYLLGCSAFAGKVRVKPTVPRTACAIIVELMRGVLERDFGGQIEQLWRAPAPWGDPDAPGEQDEPAGEADSLEPQGGQRTANAPREPDRVPGLVKAGGGQEAGRSRSIPTLDRDAHMPTIQREPADLLVDDRQPTLADADEVRRWASQLVLRKAGELRDGATQHAHDALVSEPWWQSMQGELDLDGSLAAYVRTAGRLQATDLRMLARARQARDYLILVDHSGSMVGKKLLLSAVLAAVLAQLTAEGRGDYGVLAFDDNVASIKSFDESRDVEAVIETVLRLPEGRATDLSRAFRLAADLCGARPAGHTTDCILISDCMPTRGDATYAGLERLAQAIGPLYVAYVEEAGAAIELFSPNGPRQRFDLYEWWARRWVGEEHFQSVHEIQDVGGLVDRLSGIGPGDRL
jgi:MoxR-like ATPase